MRVFKNIRKQLAAENNVGKYLRYAIGEIFLVVIGILIALQVNNWNTHRKNKQFASYILGEIHKDLVSDQDLIYMGIEPRLKKKEIGVKNVMHDIKTGSPLPDNVFMKDYSWMISRFYLTYTSGSYQSLKLKGLNILDNRNLSDELFHFYEETLPRALVFIQGGDKMKEQNIHRLEEKVFRLKIVQAKNGTLIETMIPASPNYLKNQSLQRIVNICAKDTQDKRYRLSHLEKDYRKISRLVEQELTKRSILFTPFDSTKVIPDF